MQVDAVHVLVVVPVIVSMAVRMIVPVSVSVVVTMRVTVVVAVVVVSECHHTNQIDGQAHATHNE
jgi:hypothetical protein